MPTCPCPAVLNANPFVDGAHPAGRTIDYYRGEHLVTLTYVDREVAAAAADAMRGSRPAAGDPDGAGRRTDPRRGTVTVSRTAAGESDGGVRETGSVSAGGVPLAGWQQLEANTIESAARRRLATLPRGALTRLNIEVRSRASFFGFGFSWGIRIFDDARVVDFGEAAP